MTESLCKSVINLCSDIACSALGVGNQQDLSNNLECNPFLNTALQRFTGLNAKNIILFPREHLKWLCLFFTKDHDSFEENDIIPDKNERDRLKKCLQNKLYSKLILKCYRPTGYYLL